MVEHAVKILSRIRNDIAPHFGDGVTFSDQPRRNTRGHFTNGAWPQAAEFNAVDLRDARRRGNTHLHIGVDKANAMPPGGAYS